MQQSRPQLGSQLSLCNVQFKLLILNIADAEGAIRTAYTKYILAHNVFAYYRQVKKYHILFNST